MGCHSCNLPWMKVVRKQTVQLVEVPQWQKKPRQKPRHDFVELLIQQFTEELIQQYLTSNWRSWTFFWTCLLHLFFFCLVFLFFFLSSCGCRGLQILQIWFFWTCQSQIQLEFDDDKGPSKGVSKSDRSPYNCVVKNFREMSQLRTYNHYSHTHQFDFQQITEPRQSQKILPAEIESFGK